MCSIALFFVAVGIFQASALPIRHSEKVEFPGIGLDYRPSNIAKDMLAMSWQALLRGETFCALTFIGYKYFQSMLPGINSCSLWGYTRVCSVMHPVAFRTEVRVSIDTPGGIESNSNGLETARLQCAGGRLVACVKPSEVSRSVVGIV